MNPCGPNDDLQHTIERVPDDLYAWAVEQRDYLRANFSGLSQHLRTIMPNDKLALHLANAIDDGRVPGQMTVQYNHIRKKSFANEREHWDNPAAVILGGYSAVGHRCVKLWLFTRTWRDSGIRFQTCAEGTTYISAHHCYVGHGTTRSVIADVKTVIWRIAWIDAQEIADWAAADRDTEVCAACDVIKNYLE